MNDKELLSETQIDFLREMMNIGAGNAATALSDMLGQEVSMIIPKVQVFQVSQVPSILDDPSLPVASVRMGMVGDASGDLFFITPDEDKTKLTHLVQWATPGQKKLGPDVDLSILTEVGNIIAGVYLTAIHDFCKLSIYHTVPTSAIDMIQSVLDESITAMSHQSQVVFLIENEFVIEQHHIRTFFLIMPSASSTKTIANSIGQAQIGYIAA